MCDQSYEPLGPNIQTLVNIILAPLTGALQDIILPISLTTLKLAADTLIIHNNLK